MQKKNKGFSLVEFAIVLVIIGLLIGGIMAGASLKSAAQLQAVISDFGKYKQAANLFKTKYYYWPGDHPTADETWNGSPNGNGNNRIGGVNAGNSHPAGGTCATAGNICRAGESYNAFYHLTSAGLIPNISASSNDGSLAVGDSTLPRAPLDRFAGMTLRGPVYVFTYTGLGATAFNRNVFSISDMVSGVNTAHQSGAVLPKDAKSIDIKIDDGLASDGFLRGFDNATTTSTCLTGGNYDLVTSTAKCIVSMDIE